MNMYEQILKVVSIRLTQLEVIGERYNDEYMSLKKIENECRVLIKLVHNAKSM